MPLNLANLDDGTAFKVITPEGHTFSIWADGRIDGFGPGCVVINRIPAHANAVALRRAEQIAA